MPSDTVITSPTAAAAGKLTLACSKVGVPEAAISAAFTKPSLLVSSTMLTVGLVVTTFALSLAVAPTLPAISVTCALTVKVWPSSGVL